MPRADTVANPALRLDASVRSLTGVGPVRARALERIGVRTVEDLLYHLPLRYEDRRDLVRVADVRPGTRCRVSGEIRSVRRSRTRSRGPVVRVTVGQDGVRLEAVWFRQGYLRERFRVGDRIVLYGAVREDGGLRMYHPDFEVLSPDGDGEAPDAGGEAGEAGLVPVHPATDGIGSRTIRRLVREALARVAPDLADPLPAELRKRRDLVPIERALQDVHFPSDPSAGKRARRRLAYQEFLLLQLGLALRRDAARRGTRRRPYRLDPSIDRQVRGLFPFRFTREQEGAIADVRADLAGHLRMNRLLQGEVGSGKTAVALYAMLLAAASGRQAAIMAPTEIVAEQHLRTIRSLGEERSLDPVHLPGGLGRAERRRRLERIARGEALLVVGTHALIEGDVRFRDLGLVVIDEQHKFGVSQRARLGEKGERPDVLVMTATPIPRTLSLTVFGDLDVTTIRELPPGRTPPRTRIALPGRHGEAMEAIRAELRAGRQGYYVCPLVEETRASDLAAAVRERERLRAEVFPEFRVGLLHGRQSTDEKGRVMGEFRRGAIHLLVATTVVEVGVDLPRATVMAIADAERFGLAQLHQMRGRIGRGDVRGTCWLLVGDGEARGVERLRVLAGTSDGFRIAEEDLRVRGPGEFFGTRQHGLPRLRAGDPTVDRALLEGARRDAFSWVERDPGLRSGDPAARFRDELGRRFPDALRWIGVG
jgi:ATP-dependent DNA helicase RecG